MLASTSIFDALEVGAILSSVFALTGAFAWRQASARARVESELARKQIETLEREARLLRQRASAIIDRASEGILLARADDLLLLAANPAARRLLGVAEGPLPRLPEVCQISLGSEESFPMAAHEWFALIQRRRQLRLLRNDGHVIEAMADVIPVEENGQAAYQFFLREVTDRVRLEEQLRQAEKLSTLGQMVCSIAHELCNPLAVVNGYVELLMERRDLEESVTAQLAKMKFESNRASKLVKNFLSYARQRPARRELVNLNDVVQRAIDVRALELRDECAEIILKLDADLPRTMADFDQAQQILVNLIHNSLQAIGNTKMPRLTFTTCTLDETVVMKVEDNGPGIPKELLNRIFEPFFTTKPAGIGTGLGLSIAHRLMAEHNGRIYYTASSDGGAAFVLEFPRSHEEPKTEKPIELSPAQSIAVDAPAGHLRRVLILDDQQTIADLLTEMVRLIGYEAHAESDPRKALERVEEEEFDVIVSDYRMPEMNGQEFYRAAIALRPELAQRIIFLTGDLLNEETQQFLKSTGARYLTKPFQLAKIQQSINDVLHDHEFVG